MDLPRNEAALLLLSRGQSWVRGVMFLALLTGLVFPLSANPPIPQLQRVFPGGCQVGQSLLVTVSTLNPSCLRLSAREQTRLACDCVLHSW